MEETPANVPFAAQEDAVKTEPNAASVETICVPQNYPESPSESTLEENAVEEEKEDCADAQPAPPLPAPTVDSITRLISSIHENIVSSNQAFSTGIDRAIAVIQEASTARTANTDRENEPSPHDDAPTDSGSSHVDSAPVPVDDVGALVSPEEEAIVQDATQNDSHRTDVGIKDQVVYHERAAACGNADPPPLDATRPAWPDRDDRTEETPERRTDLVRLLGLVAKTLWWAAPLILLIGAIAVSGVSCDTRDGALTVSFAPRIGPIVVPYGRWFDSCERARIHLVDAIMGTLPEHWRVSTREATIATTGNIGAADCACLCRIDGPMILGRIAADTDGRAVCSCACEAAPLYGEGDRTNPTHETRDGAVEILDWNQRVMAIAMGGLLGLTAYGATLFV